MAKAHEGPGYVCRFPEKFGGGSVLMRYLPLDQKRRLRKKHGDDTASLGEDMVLRCIVEVSSDIADAAGVHGGELSARGLVPVDDSEPGRDAVWGALGDQRRQLLEVAWIRKCSVAEEEVDPFLALIEDVC